MCGIVALADNRTPLDPKVLDRMTDTLAHRGPDGSGARLFRQGTRGLGHRRLSIIDLSNRGAQPMANETGDIWVTFNGEIYNFAALRRELMDLGHVFASDSDTEVLVHGYEAWEDDLPSRLRGMFAFVVYDRARDRFLAARDPFGVKPLYYLADAQRFAAASELKALMAGPWDLTPLDYDGLAGAFAFGCVPAPRSVRRHVSKLPPGTLAVYEQGRLRLAQFHAFTFGDRRASLTEAAEDLAHALHESVTLHTVSDVPVGLFLSGGLDSSTLAWAQAVAGQPLRAFCMSMHGDPRSEEEDARRVAKRCGHPLSLHTAGNATVELWRRLVVHFDEPFADTSMLPTYLLSEFAAKGHAYKVVLGGDGGDELFAGYLWYARTLEQVASGEKSLTGAYAVQPYDFFLRPGLDQLFTPGFTERMHAWRENLASRFGTGDLSLQSMQRCDLGLYLPDDILTKVDRASMAQSLEVRVPFCDHVLAERVLAYHPSVYAPNHEGKAIIKRILSDYYPPEVINKTKRGFSIPLEKYLLQHDYVSDIRQGPLRELGVFRPGALDTFLEYPLNGNASRMAFLWLLNIWASHAFGAQQQRPEKAGA